MAGASALNRLELSNHPSTRGHKLSQDPSRIEACRWQMGARCLPKPAEEIVVDWDAMGHRRHGMQEGRHYRAYYDEDCYRPLSVFVGDIPSWAQLRTGEKDGADGVVAALEKIVAAIRQRCRRARIIVRGDSGFCREEIMAWCQGQEEVYYCLGLAKNSAWVERLGPALANPPIRWRLGGAANVRQFAGFEHQTVRRWSRSRRVIGKAEVTAQGSNPRFIVTHLPAQGFQGDEDKTRFMPARLYEELGCGRGEMENMLKQQTLDLRADRMSTHHLASNQLRLRRSALACLLLERMRTLGRDGTQLARATAGSARLKLLKVAGQARASGRRV